MSNSSLAVIILAAGSSQRFDAGNKLDHVIDGISVLERSLIPYSVLAAEAHDRLLVHREGHETAVQAAAGSGFRPVVNHHAARGQATSVRTGIEALKSPLPGWILIGLGDMPFLKPDTVARLTRACDPDFDVIMPTHNGRRGNPVIWHNRHLTELSALTGDQGARPLLKRADVKIKTVEVTDTGILHDIDTVTDLPARGTRN